MRAVVVAAVVVVVVPMPLALSLLLLRQDALVLLLATSSLHQISPC